MRVFNKILLGLTLIVLGVVLFFTFGQNHPSAHMSWGVSFSRRAAEPLGLDWRKTYLAILDDLQVNHLRIGSYWDETEPGMGKYDFSDLDFMMQQARDRQASVILTVGRRQPRWPECHVPSWAKDLPKNEQEEKVLQQVQAVVERYRNYANISAWQVENEFFVTWFGTCPAPDAEFLKKEISLVKSLDNRPVILTDTGELSLWYRTAKYADIFGTTMYRRAFNPYFGVGDWPYPPVYYSRLGWLIQRFTNFKKIIIAELQAEPWAKTTVQNDSTEINYLTMSPQQFEKNLEYAKNSGIDEAYLWGVEWWYYMKEKRGIPFFWDTAKELWQ